MFAAVNSPRSVTLSGSDVVLQNIQKRLEDKDVFARILRVNAPYHSHYLEPYLENAKEVFKRLKPRNAGIPFYSTVTGCILEGNECDKNYWWENIRQPVNFRSAVHHLIEDRYKLFIEIGPHPVLSRSIKECLEESGTQGEIIASLIRKKDEFMTLSLSLASLYTRMAIAGVLMQKLVVLFSATGRALLYLNPWTGQSPMGVTIVSLGEILILCQSNSVGLSSSS